MSSIVFNSLLNDLVRGNVNFASDTFKIMLVNNFVPDKDAHSKRSSVTGEVVGTGYSSGGVTIAVTLTQDNTNDRQDISFATTTWANATITANGAVIYKSRGGASSADELVAFVDLGSTTSTNGNFSVSFTSPLRFQN